MPSKKKTPAAVKPARTSKPAAKARQAFVVNIYPHAAEFFIPGHLTPFSVMANGPEGSDAADQLAKRLARLKKTHPLTIQNADPLAKEVTP